MPCEAKATQWRSNTKYDKNYDYGIPGGASQKITEPNCHNTALQHYITLPHHNHTTTLTQLTHNHTNTGTYSITKTWKKLHHFNTTPYRYLHHHIKKVAKKSLQHFNTALYYHLKTCATSHCNTTQTPPTCKKAKSAVFHLLTAQSNIVAPTPQNITTTALTPYNSTTTAQAPQCSTTTHPSQCCTT